MTQTANAATLLAREHDEINRLATRIDTLAPGPERAGLVREICTRFLVHAEVEELYLYPVVRRLLRDGPFVAGFHTRRNHAVARTIDTVRRGKVDGDELDVLVGHLVVGVQDHVERQDAVLLPALIDACPIDEINELGESLHEGIRTARRAADRDSSGRRADVRGREKAQEKAQPEPGPVGAGPAAAGRDAEGEEPEQAPRRRGFWSLFRRRARADRPANSD